MPQTAARNVLLYGFHVVTTWPNLWISWQRMTCFLTHPQPYQPVGNMGKSSLSEILSHEIGENNQGFRNSKPGIFLKYVTLSVSAGHRNLYFFLHISFDRHHTLIRQ